MRASVVNDDPGFKNFGYYGQWNIFLDGRPVDLCITADDDEGFVLVLDVDENGQAFANEDGTDTAKKIMRGKVEILEKHQL